MKQRLLMIGLCCVYCSAVMAQTLDPWIGKYCMSFFTKTRTAKTVGDGHTSVALKTQWFDWDQVERTDKSYSARTSGQSKQQLSNTLTIKHGWAKDHHVAVGIPYLANDYDIPGKINDHDGLSNVFIFEKWNFMKETQVLPSMAVDLWYYLPTGNEGKGLGINDGAYKVTTEVSKTWKDYSLHFNPGYTWGDDNNYEVGEINGGVFFTPCKTLWPAVEYNYFYKEGKGHRQDIVPGLIFKFKGGSFKVAAPINMSTTFKDRDPVGLVMKLFFRH